MLEIDTNPSPLMRALCEFRSKVNENTRVHTLIKDWNPLILVEAVDSGSKVYLPVRDGKITTVSTAESSAGHLVHLRSSEQTLIAIFTGRSNPASAFLDGELEVFASDKDQIKLDAISLVLWGL